MLSSARQPTLRYATALAAIVLNHQPGHLLERCVGRDRTLDDEIGLFCAGAGLHRESVADSLEQGERSPEIADTESNRDDWIPDWLATRSRHDLSLLNSPES